MIVLGFLVTAAQFSASYVERMVSIVMGCVTRCFCFSTSFNYIQTKCSFLSPFSFYHPPTLALHNIALWYQLSSLDFTQNICDIHMQTFICLLIFFSFFPLLLALLSLHINFSDLFAVSFSFFCFSFTLRHLCFFLSYYLVFPSSVFLCFIR